MGEEGELNEGGQKRNRLLENVSIRCSMNILMCLHGQDFLDNDCKQPWLKDKG